MSVEKHDFIFLKDSTLMESSAVVILIVQANCKETKTHTFSRRPQVTLSLYRLKGGYTQRGTHTNSEKTKRSVQSIYCPIHNDRYMYIVLNTLLVVGFEIFFTACMYKGGHRYHNQLSLVSRFVDAQ